MIVLWAAAMYLAQEKKNYWICAIPAVFMSAVSVTYFFHASECLGAFLNTYEAGAPKSDATVVKWATHISYPAGLIAAALFFFLFWRASAKYRGKATMQKEQT